MSEVTLHLTLDEALAIDAALSARAFETTRYIETTRRELAEHEKHDKCCSSDRLPRWRQELAILNQVYRASQSAYEKVHALIPERGDRDA